MITKYFRFKIPEHFEKQMFDIFVIESTSGSLCDWKFSLFLSAVYSTIFSHTISEKTNQFSEHVQKNGQ